MALAVVRDIRAQRPQLGPEELADFETDVMAGLVLARSSAGLADKTIREEIGQLELVRSWFGRPLWELEPQNIDRYFGIELRAAAKGTRHARAVAITTYFSYLELRHKVEIHQLTGRVVECPIDEMNRPRGNKAAALRIPPTATEMDAFFRGWRAELVTCRKYATTARNYTAAKLMSLVGLRINEVRCLDLDDIKWDLGRFGKLHVRQGKGSRGSGPRERMVPLIHGADALLRWFIEDIWGLFGGDHTCPGAPLFPSERTNRDTGASFRVGTDALRAGLATAVDANLPEWTNKLTPHVLRHFCASDLYLSGMDLISIQETLGHAWVATTMRYIHVHKTRIEDAWIAAQERAAQRLEGLLVP